VALHQSDCSKATMLQSLHHAPGAPPPEQMITITLLRTRYPGGPVTLTARPSRAARPFRPSRTAALLLGGGLLLGPLAGCAQPGQLGQPLPAPQPAPIAAPVPPLPAPAEPVSGTLDGRVTVRTAGPTVYSVRTVVLEPGEALDWHRHPGTEMAIVQKGDVRLVREGACTPARFTEGQALFVGDGVAHRLTNDGDELAELLVTSLLTPGAPDTTEVEPACPRA
jgi:quercetin dioxygenase-like cupin family protein